MAWYLRCYGGDETTHKDLGLLFRITLDITMVSSLKQSTHVSDGCATESLPHYSSHDNEKGPLVAVLWWYGSMVPYHTKQ